MDQIRSQVVAMRDKLRQEIQAAKDISEVAAAIVRIDALNDVLEIIDGASDPSLAGAAPDMLAALKAALPELEYLECYMGSPESPHAFVREANAAVVSVADQVRAAIAKATRT